MSISLDVFLRDRSHLDLAAESPLFLSRAIVAEWYTALRSPHGAVMGLSPKPPPLLVWQDCKYVDQKGFGCYAEPLCSQQVL